MRPGANHDSYRSAIAKANRAAKRWTDRLNGHLAQNPVGYQNPNMGTYGCIVRGLHCAQAAVAELRRQFATLPSEDWPAN